MFKKLLPSKVRRKMFIFLTTFAVMGAVVAFHLLYITNSPLIRTVFAADRSGSQSVNLWGQEQMEIPMPSQEQEQTEAVPSAFVYLEEVPLSHELQEYTYQRCQALDLEYELILALMWRESGFQTNAVHYNGNGTSDSGIMQVNSINTEWLRRDHGIEDLMDPYQNIDAGTAILAKYMSKYETTQALMAYQYGDAGMRSKLKQGITTNKLVNVALEKRDYYKALLQQV